MRLRSLFFALLLPVTTFATVYDCCTFFNETNILEVRLNELYDYVDKFVIVEAGEGFSGLPHDYLFEQVRTEPRFAKFADKIIYIKVESPINENTGCIWKRSNYIKNQCMRGLVNCQPDDLILFSDVDEFPRGEMIPRLAEAIKTTPIIGILQKMYRHFLNRYSGLWMGTVAIRYDWLTTGPVAWRKHEPNGFRSFVSFSGGRELDGVSIPVWEGGWHFTSMNGFNKFQEKCQNWEHFKNPYPQTIESWRAEVNGHALIEIDDTFPQFVRENIDYLTDVGLIDTVPEANSSREVLETSG